MNPTQHIESCDQYLGKRSGRYEWRCQRYDCTIDEMMDISPRLNDGDTICDVGAGWTEFAARLFERADQTGARPRYFPVDGCLDGTNLETWVPPRKAEYFVALELLEHLENPFRLVEAMQRSCEKAILISTPNPETTNVLGMDRTHKTPIHLYDLIAHGFCVREESFYGQQRDSLFGVWLP